LLLEAYVALGHDALARKACEEWRRAEPDSPLDPVELSPKILRACISAAAMRSVGPTTVDDLAISASASVPSARPVRSAKPPPTESP
jgi:hypothetical protein